jgi:hypothetical protein
MGLPRHRALLSHKAPMLTVTTYWSRSWNGLDALLRGRYGLPGKLACNIVRNDKNDYGRCFFKFGGHQRPNTLKPTCLDQVRSVNRELEQHQHWLEGFGGIGGDKGVRRGRTALLGPETNSNDLEIDVSKLPTPY